MPNDATAKQLLDRLGDLENCPQDALVAYKEFEMDGKTYYFTPGGFLYRKEPEMEHLGASSVRLPHRRGLASQDRR